MSWLSSYRRLRPRYECYRCNYLPFLELAAAPLLLQARLGAMGREVRLDHSTVRRFARATSIDELPVKVVSRRPRSTAIPPAPAAPTAHPRCRS